MEEPKYKGPGFFRSAVLVLTLISATALATHKNYSCMERHVTSKIRAGIEKVIEVDKYLESKFPEPVKKLNEWNRRNIYDPIIGTDSRDVYKKK